MGWSEIPGDWDKRGKATADWNLPKDLTVKETIGHLGRSFGNKIPEQLTSAAVFLILRSGEADKLDLEHRPHIDWKGGDPVPIVLQLRTPDENKMKMVSGWTQEHVRTLRPGEKGEFEIDVYNFNHGKVTGTLRLVESPEGWQVEPKEVDLRLDIMDRKRIPITVLRPGEEAGGEENWLEWEFSGPEPSSENPRLAVRVIDPTAEK